MKNALRRLLVLSAFALTLSVSLMLTSCGKCELDDSTPERPYHGEWKVLQTYECGATYGKYECSACGTGTSEFLACDYTKHIAPEPSWENYVADAEQTCTEGGMWASGNCPHCGLMIDMQDVSGNQGSIDKLQPLGHNLITVPEKEPTCLEGGYSSYVYCDRCNTIDPEGTGQTKQEYGEYGHSYEEFVNGYANCLACGELAIDVERGYYFDNEILYSLYDGSYRISKFFNTEITELVIPTELNGKKVSFSLEWDVLAELTKLTKLTIPEDSYISIDDETYIPEALLTVESGVRYMANGDNKYYFVLEQLDTSITSISLNAQARVIMYGAFSSCTALETAVIPEGIVRIYSAFAGCSGLVSASLPSTLTYMRGTFEDCYALETVNIPAGVVEIGEYTFERCQSLTQIELPASVKSIGACAFSDSGLTQINLGKVESISISAFERTRIENVDLSSAKHIGYRAFYMCVSKTVYAPLAETEMEGYALGFSVSSLIKISVHINNLDAVYSAEELTILGEGVFAAGTLTAQSYNAPNDLYNVVIGDGFTSIEEGAIVGLPELLSITFGAGIETIGMRCFEDLPKLEVLYVSDNIKDIRYVDFPDTGVNDCPNLHLDRGNFLGSRENPYVFLYKGWSVDEQSYEIRIPEGTKSIKAWAFYDISVTYKVRVILPSSIQYLGEAAFDYLGDVIPTVSEDGDLYLGNDENPYMVLYSCSQRTGTFTVKSETKIITETAFYDADGLTVQLHSGVVQYPDPDDDVTFLPGIAG